MAYSQTRDTMTRTDGSTPGRNITLITPDDANDLATYPKALRVYVPAAISEATLRVTPARAAAEANAADQTPSVLLKFPSGVTVEPLQVRKVWAADLTAGGVVVHGYGD